MGQKVANNGERAALQEAIDKLIEWTRRWGMELNINMCKVMHLGHNNPGHKYTMGGAELGGAELGSTEQERDIGVAVMSNLSPTAQCAKAARNASTVLSQLSRSFHFRDRHVFV